MNLLAHLYRSVHHLQHSLHLPWQQGQTGDAPPGGGLVLTVAMLSVAAAALLVLAP